MIGNRPKGTKRNKMKAKQKQTGHKSSRKKEIRPNGPDWQGIIIGSHTSLGRDKNKVSPRSPHHPP